jgi:hypothetical protein
MILRCKPDGTIDIHNETNPEAAARKAPDLKGVAASDGPGALTRFADCSRNSPRRLGQAPRGALRSIAGSPAEWLLDRLTGLRHLGQEPTGACRVLETAGRPPCLPRARPVTQGAVENGCALVIPAPLSRRHSPKSAISMLC